MLLTLIKNRYQKGDADASLFSKQTGGTMIKGTKDFRFLTPERNGMSTHEITKSVTLEHIETGLSVHVDVFREQVKNRNHAFRLLISELENKGYNYDEIKEKLLCYH